MRLGTPTSNEYLKELGGLSGSIQATYGEVMAGLVRPSMTRVMLGDSTITEQATFDPGIIREYYMGVAGRLAGWAVRDVAATNNEDLRRIFVKFEVREGNYLLSGHLSVQFHVLLYYTPDYRVVECQKELAGVIEEAKGSEEEAAKSGEGYISRRMGEAGYGELGHQDLFEALYRDDGLRESIRGGVDEGMDEDLRRLAKRKGELLAELDRSLVETYQTTDVLIDDTRLVSGEEGILCTLDLEFVKGGLREGLFDAKKIPPHIREQIRGRLGDLGRILGAPMQDGAPKNTSKI